MKITKIILIVLTLVGLIYIVEIFMKDFILEDEDGEPYQSTHYPVY